jgi:hypothetical protein
VKPLARVAPALLLALATGLPPGALGAAELTVDEVLSRHAEARGGVERWKAVRALRLEGEYDAFSLRSHFTLLRQRPHYYRLDFEMLEEPAIRARGPEATWGLHKLLTPEPARVDGPYQPQMERESLFGPLLLEAEAHGLVVELLGPGEIDGVETVGLDVTFPGGGRETWHLGAATFLEVAVDSRIYDFTQAGEPVALRTFYEDFREVEGLVIPHQLYLEFNHRLEAMAVESVEVNPEIDPAVFAAPPPTEDTAEEAPDEG